MSEESESAPAIAWDPACPARLLVLRDEVRPLWSHPGASICNAYEISALTKIIQAHSKYHERLDREELFLRPSKVFSRKCREALKECLTLWQAELDRFSTQHQQQQQDEPQQNRGETPEKISTKKEQEKLSKENFEILDCTYRLMNLSDVILPLLPTDDWMREDPFRMPGAASADFIRYLRFNHMDHPIMGKEEIIHEMLESRQPEHYGGDGGATNTTLYWQYIEVLVIRGLLDEAWEALERHSQYQASQLILTDRDDHYGTTGTREIMQEIYEGFLILKQVLGRAPLPGGRNDKNDDCLGIPDNEEDEEDEIMAEDTYLVGLEVEPSDYTFWEIDTFGEDTNDNPLFFTPEAAIHRHRMWQTYVQQTVRGQLARFIRRVPEIKKILNILCGDFSQVDFETWPEKLCALILYRTPDCRPRDLSVLTHRTMSEIGVGDPDISRSIVRILQGDAGAAINLHYAWGAGAGAALPTTLLSVLYNMYMTAQIIRPDPEEIDRKIELLRDAAFAIISSMSSLDSDMAIDLATRLLLPYIDQERVGAEIAACLADILERYNPKSDSGASNAVNRCEQALKEKKNRRVLEGCISVVLCRYRYHREQNHAGSSLSWLLRGIRLESSGFGPMETGSCFRNLSTLCDTVTEKILSALSQGTALSASTIEMAAGMADEIERDDNPSNSGAIKARQLRPILLFLQARKMFGAVQRGDRSILPECIITCLEKGAAKREGPPVMFAPSPFRKMLLEIACKLLEDDFEEAHRMGRVSSHCVFDKRAIAKLVSVWDPTSVGEEESKMQEILLRGISQAFVAENVSKAEFRDNRGAWRSPGSIDISSIRSDNLANHTRSLQEAVVHRMLDF